MKRKLVWGMTIIILIAALLLPLIAFASAPIACGQALSGSITAAGQKDSYTFTISATDVVRIKTFESTGNMRILTELYNSSGNRLATSSGNTGEHPQIELSLTADTYTIVVSDQNSTGTGAYSLYWTTINNPCATKTPISCSQPLSDAIDSAYQLKYYTLTLPAADVVRIEAIETSGNMDMHVELYNASGSRVADMWGGTGSYLRMDPSLAAGTYTIIISDRNFTGTGAYTLYWTTTNNPCATKTPISCSQPLSDTIDSAYQQKYYTFTLSEADVVRIKALETAGNMNMRVELYNSSGGRVGDMWGGTGSYLRMDPSLAAGTYTIIVSDKNFTGTGTYDITWFRLASPCNAADMACGETIAGFINENLETNAYTFTANSGDAVTITMTRTPRTTIYPYIELYNNSGSKLAESYSTSDSPATITYSIPGSATYNIFASDHTYISSGGYQINLQKNGNSCPGVTLITPDGGEVIVGGTTYAITWISTSPQGVASQEIRLSTDGGLTFPTVIATGLPGTAQSFNWVVPDSFTTHARIRVIATDAAGQTVPGDSATDFAIVQGNEKYTRTYGYDKLNRLNSVTYEDSSTASFSYDPVGNRLAVAGSGPGSTYTVTPSAGANGSISPSTPQTVNFNSTTSFTVTPNAGYHIASITGCGGALSGSTYTTGPITGSCAVTATFDMNTYTVTPSAGANGTISPSTPQTVNYNATTSFTVKADKGHKISSVTGCGGKLTGSTYTTGPITADCAVTATFN